MTSTDLNHSAEGRSSDGGTGGPPIAADATATTLVSPTPGPDWLTRYSPSLIRVFGPRQPAPVRGPRRLLAAAFATAPVDRPAGVAAPPPVAALRARRAPA